MSIDDQTAKAVDTWRAMKEAIPQHQRVLKIHNGQGGITELQVSLPDERDLYNDLIASGNVISEIVDEEERLVVTSMANASRQPVVELMNRE